MMKSTIICYFISLLFGLLLGEELGYEDVTRSVKNCSGFHIPRDRFSLGCIRISAAEGNLNGLCYGNSCSDKKYGRRRLERNDNLIKQLCECKPSCAIYNTCCLDSPNKLVSRPVPWQNDTEYSCEHVKHTLDFSPIFMKNKCNSNGQYDKAVISLCEDDIETFKDPMAFLPVTNPRTSTTYKNYFCSICNDDSSDLIFWSIGVNVNANYYSERDALKKLNTSNVFENIVYNNETSEWGILHDSPYRRPKPPPGITVNPILPKVFKPVSILIQLPSQIEDSITYCVSDAISDCDPNWKDDAVKDKCHSYMSLIDVFIHKDSDLRRFRNIHCAICNFAGTELNVDCPIPKNCPTCTSITPVRPMSLSWVIDVNNRDGDQVGEIKGCKAGDAFDPFFKKCRTMTCIEPGYVQKNGKCTPS